MKTGGHLSVLHKDSGSLLADIPYAHDWACQLVADVSSLAELCPFSGAEGFLAEEDELGAILLQLLHTGLQGPCGLVWPSWAPEISTVCTTFLWVPVTQNSSKLTPLPAGTLV